MNKSNQGFNMKIHTANKNSSKLLFSNFLHDEPYQKPNKTEENQVYQRKPKPEENASLKNLRNESG